MTQCQENESRFHYLCLQVPGVTGGGEVCLKLITQVTPPKRGEPKMLEGLHGTDPMGLRGGEVGLDNIPKKEFTQVKL